MNTERPLEREIGKMFDDNGDVPQGREQKILVSKLNRQLEERKYVEPTMLKLAEVAYQRQRDMAASGEGE